MNYEVRFSLTDCVQIAGKKQRNFFDMEARCNRCASFFAKNL
jgi:hypothetical protein